jgi:hypothetical protein
MGSAVHVHAQSDETIFGIYESGDLQYLIVLVTVWFVV